RLAQREDIVVKVFFTWHAGEGAVEDYGFKIPVAWDIPLAEGYDFELVPNLSSDPGTHHFFGLRNPSLVDRVMAWRPDVVHITGWAWFSHLLAMRAFRAKKVPTLFRGDSHLLGSRAHGLRWLVKRTLLKQVFSWPTGFLAVGGANRAYFQAFGVGPGRLFPCPHSIDVARFAEPGAKFEQEAANWRQQLGIPPNRCVLLFAGKFERIKRPVQLMRAVQAVSDQAPVLVMIGGGELEKEVKAIAEGDSDQFRVLAFQNQSHMPVVCRLGDIFVLPSARETWGLSVNEALACGRPVLVSDGVGCAADVVDASCGRVFSSTDHSTLERMTRMLSEMTRDL